MIELNSSKMEQERLSDGRTRLKMVLDVTYGEREQDQWLPRVLLEAWRNLVRVVSLSSDECPVCTQTTVDPCPYCQTLGEEVGNS